MIYPRLVHVRSMRRRLGVMAAIVGLLGACTHTIYLVPDGDGGYTEVDDPGAVGAPHDAYEEVIVDDGGLEVVVLPSHDAVLIDETGAYVYVLLEVEAPPGARRARPPLSVSLVVDRSGSMGGAKMDAAKAAALSLLDDLADGDRVSLVTYASDVTIDVPAITLDRRSRGRFERAIAAIGAAGGTDIAGGLAAGAAEVLRDYARDDLNRVILVSDGRPTVGVTDGRQLSVHAARLYEEGVTLTTMGIGHDYNEDLMTELAVVGGGNYYYVASPRQMAGAIDREMQTFGATVARDLELDLRLPPGARVHEVFGYPHEVRGDGATIQLHTLSAGQRRQVLVALDVSATRGRPSGPRPVARGALSYRAADGGAARSVALPEVAVRTTRDPRVAAASARAPVIEKVERVRNAQLREAVMERLDGGDRDVARGLVERRLDAARAASRAAPRSRVLAQEVEDLEGLSRDVDAAPAPASPEYRHLRKREKARALDALMY